MMPGTKHSRNEILLQATNRLTFENEIMAACLFISIHVATFKTIKNTSKQCIHNKNNECSFN